MSRSLKNKIDHVSMKRQFVRKLWGEIFEMTSNALPFSGEKAILFYLSWQVITYRYLRVTKVVADHGSEFSG